MNNALQLLRQDLIQSSDKKTKASFQRFFKEEVNHYGVKTGTVQKIAKTYLKEMKVLTKTDIFDLCELLWQSGVIEESFVAGNWAYSVRKQFAQTDIDIFEGWIQNYVNNWASCDSFCNHSVGELIEMYPDLVNRLKTWAESDNMWVRRAAAVSLIVPAKKGLFLDDVFEIATILLHDKEDLVQKGYGWMLKVASKEHEMAVFNYVMQHKTTMPRTALRYAIEKMPAELKALAMAR